jgi:hypothetical protein
LAAEYNETLAAASVFAAINVFALIPILAAVLVLNLATPVVTFNQQLRETTKVSITSTIVKEQLQYSIKQQPTVNKLIY